VCISIDKSLKRL